MVFSVAPRLSSSAAATSAIGRRKSSSASYPSTSAGVGRGALSPSTRAACGVRYDQKPQGAARADRLGLSKKMSVAPPALRPHRLRGKRTVDPRHPHCRCSYGVTRSGAPLDCGSGVGGVPEPVSLSASSRFSAHQLIMPLYSHAVLGAMGALYDWRC